MATRRRGFVLLAVLWVMVGVTLLGLAISIVARDAITSTRNRTELIRAGWAAEGCAERVRAAIAEALQDRRAAALGESVWAQMDRWVWTAPVVDSRACGVTLRPAGASIDLNTASGENLTSLFRALGHGPERSDSLAAALLDWRDEDDIPRPYGAERLWYEERQRRPPRNGPFADINEIGYVRGFGSIAGIDSVLGVEPGRVCLKHAPRAVLAALPGVGTEAVERILDARRRGETMVNLRDIIWVSPAAGDPLLGRYAELSRATTTEPDAWVVVSRAASGRRPITAVVELRLVRAGERAAVVRRRTWIE